jgi:hypothetical protein
MNFSKRRSDGLRVFEGLKDSEGLKTSEDSKELRGTNSHQVQVSAVVNA